MPTTTVNQINIYYENHGAGQPVLFIHGLGSSTLDWEFQVPFFEKKYQVITVDLRGHGKSDKPNDPYSIPLFAADIAQFIRQVIQQPVHIVGHSLGGMTAFQLALDAPDLVKSLTIINSGPAVSFPTLRSRILFHLRTLSVRVFGMQKLSHHLAEFLFPAPSQSQLRETFIKRWMENDPDAYLNALHVFNHWDVTNRLPSIKCPTLVLAADNDYTPILYKELYTRMIPNAEMIVIRKSWHMSILDQPDAVNEAIDKFLTQHFGQTS